MKKVFSIILVLVALLIVCTACDPTVKGGKDKDPSPNPDPLTVEEMQEFLNEMATAEHGVMWIFIDWSENDYYTQVVPYDEVPSIFDGMEEYAEGMGFTIYPRIERDVLIISMANEISGELYLFCKPSETEDVLNAYCPSLVHPTYPIAINTYAEYVEATNKLGTKSGSIILGYCTSSGTWSVRLPSTDVFSETGKGGYSSYSEISWISDGVIELVSDGDYTYMLNNGNTEDIMFAIEEAEKHPRVLM